MVKRIDFTSVVGPEKGSFKTPTNALAKSGKNFMEVLRSEFSRVKENLKEVPGLPGVYSLSPQPPQTLKDLNVTSKVV